MRYIPACHTCSHPTTMEGVDWQPRRSFFVDVHPTIPRSITSACPYLYLDHSFMSKSRVSHTTGPIQLLACHFYYPMSGLFLVNNRLVTLGGSAWGRRFWVDAIRSADLIQSLNVRVEGDLVLLRMTHTSTDAHARHEIPCVWESTVSLLHNQVLLLVLVKRIQRAVLRFLYRLATPKRLALAMGLHAKLGANSQLSVLPADFFGCAIVPLLNRVV